MLSSPIASRMDGVSRYAREKDWHLMFQDRMGFAHPFDWMGDGVVATIRREPRWLAFLRHLARRGVPIVDLTCDVPRFRCARVSADHVSAGRLAAAHLAERNYRSRVFFTLDWDGNVRNRIWRGFTESGPAEKWVFSRECPNVRWDDWNAVGRWLAGKFAAADKPLGVLAYSQGEAVLLMDAALGLGIRVPDELGVIAGNDDPILLESQPVPVTAVDTDLERGAVASPATRVILVGVDGLGARWIPWDDMPNLRALRDDGLYAVGRAHFPTLSAPNWTSVFSGLPIELHGTRDNSGAPKVEPWRPAAGGAADGAALSAPRLLLPGSGRYGWPPAGLGQRRIHQRLPQRRCEHRPHCLCIQGGWAVGRRGGRLCGGPWRPRQDARRRHA